VVIPFTSDQPVNARCVESLGVGKRMEYGEVNKETLKQAVFSVLADAEIKKNMEMVQKLIQEAPGNKGGAEMIVGYYQGISMQ